MEKTIWFVDIDGCLSGGKFKPFDLSAFQALERLIQERHLDVVLCTGRSLSYLEALRQVARLGRFAIADHGSILYDTETDTAVYHPLCQADTRQKLRQLSVDLEALGEKNGLWRLSHGKSGSVSLVGQGCDGLAIRATLSHTFDLTGFDTHNSGRVLDIVPAGINKWVGAQFYLNHRFISDVRTAAIGDSHGDLPILGMVDVPTCPNNAHKDVKALCHYVSPENEIRGVIDILSRDY